MKNNNTLLFEGAGWSGADTSEATNVTNCRIRTRIRNHKGRLIYLEISAGHFDKKLKSIPDYAKGLEYATFIDHLFYEDSKWDKQRNYSKSLSHLTDIHFEYNKENILKFVNDELNCSFSNMEVINDGLYVFENEDPLSDCSKEGYKPYEDFYINKEVKKCQTKKKQYK